MDRLKKNESIFQPLFTRLLPPITLHPQPTWQGFNIIVHTYINYSAMQKPISDVPVIDHL